MSFLLDKKLDHEKQCEAAIRESNTASAIFHAAKAAEFAYALAAQTPANIASRYMEDADGWLEIAEKLKRQPLKGGKGAPPSGKPGAGGSQPTADEGSADPDWLVTEIPNVTFDMIAGMLDAKKTVFEMVVYPLQNIEKAKKLGLKAGGGVLLYGPPGNGKTTLGKAIAHELQAPFYYASGAQIRSKWHGESEQRLRSLIQTAKSQPVAVLFLDDVDGLLPKRSGQSVVDNRIVVQFLSDVGGFEENDNVLLILGATNKPWDIDEAVFRTGRFDEKIFIGLPDDPARLGILKMNLKNLPLEVGFDVSAWVGKLNGYTGSDIVGLVNAAKRAALGRSIRDNADPLLTAGDLESAFRNIPSSCTDKLLQQYETFRQLRFA